jgi:uncharacterized coiled-coil protein SlyX
MSNTKFETDYIILKNENAVLREKILAQETIITNLRNELVERENTHDQTSQQLADAYKLMHLIKKNNNISLNINQASA